MQGLAYLARHGIADDAETRPVAAAAWLALLALATAVQAQGRAPAPVRVAKAKEIERGAGVSLVGDIEAVRRATVASKEEGSVIDFPLREGQFVEAGKPLARLETTVLELELKSAVATLEARKQELLELENGTRKEVLAAAQARLRAAQSLSKLAKVNFDRTKALSRQSAASQEEYEQNEAKFQTATEEVARVQAEVAELETGPRIEKIAQSRALVAAQQAAVDRMRATIERHTVVAPFAGFIVREHTQLGEWIAQGGPVVELVELNEIDVRVMVPSRYAGRVPMDQEIRVEIESVEDRLLVGKVRYIVPQADLKSRLFPVKVRLTNVFVNRQPLLRAGMLAKVDLPVGEPHKGIYVPKDAIVFGQGPPMVVKVGQSAGDGSEEKAPVAEPTAVRLGSAAENWIEVIGSVQAGDAIVVSGNERLMPGQALKIIE